MELLRTLSVVANSVPNRPTSLIMLAVPPASIKSPALNGRRTRVTNPTATLESAPGEARPIARPVAPETTMTLAVSTSKLLQDRDNGDVKTKVPT